MEGGHGDIMGLSPTCRWHWGGVNGTDPGRYLITTSYVLMVSPMELLRSRWPLPTTAHLRHFRLREKNPVSARPALKPRWF